LQVQIIIIIVTIIIIIRVLIFSAPPLTENHLDVVVQSLQLPRPERSLIWKREAKSPPIAQEVLAQGILGHYLTSVLPLVIMSRSALHTENISSDNCCDKSVWLDLDTKL